MRREVLLWSVAIAGVLLAFGVTVLTLNLTVYSATGFVRTYLDALARQDATAALELAGTAAAGDASDALLVREAMSDLEDIEITMNRTDANGDHLVTATYIVGGVAGHHRVRRKRSGTLFGLFNGWAFAQSPLSVLQLTVQHDDDFTANGVDLVVGGRSGCRGAVPRVHPERDRAHPRVAVPHRRTR